MMNRYIDEEKTVDMWREAHDRLLTAVLEYLYPDTSLEGQRALVELERIADVHVTLDQLIG